MLKQKNKKIKARLGEIDCLLDVLRLEDEDKIFLSNNIMLYTIKIKRGGYIVKATQELNLFCNIGCYSYYIINEINELVCVGNGEYIMYNKKITKKMLYRILEKYLESRLSRLILLKKTNKNV